MVIVLPIVTCYDMSSAMSSENLTFADDIALLRNTVHELQQMFSAELYMAQHALRVPVVERQDGFICLQPAFGYLADDLRKVGGFQGCFRATGNTGFLISAHGLP